ncbi:MAG: nuclease-related domain-containing protein [Syntrophales bacterium]
MKTKQSPLPYKPLHVPGQSLDELIRLQDDEIVKYYWPAALFVLLAVLDWCRWFLSSPIDPWFSSITAVLVSSYCSYKLLSLRPIIRTLKLGRDGERIVAECLETLRSEGCLIYHDIVAGDFNLDHVILSSRGIYVVETKTLSKPARGEISFRGENIIAGDQFLGTEPIIQAKAEATWLQSLLKESTGKSCFVMPVVVFPGWYVQPMPNSLKETVWVLNPKALPSFIEEQPTILDDSDVHLAAFHLSRYIRIYN